ncbi:NAD(P)-binding oxidoreductase, partial [Actinomadura sp. NPDC049753]|uniref:NAD(P)-binding oxidoreductase n=1 Tax=Actinomadura sp. NPDC049753 TaxID=3154739 RepID=UPI003421EA70
ARWKEMAPAVGGGPVHFAWTTGDETGEEVMTPGRGEVWEAYIRAKGEAEDDLRRRGALDWLILRPGRLTDDPPTGLVALAEPPIGHGAVTRDDVAAVIAALLDAGDVRRLTLDLLNGSTPIGDAVAALRPASGGGPGA